MKCHRLVTIVIASLLLIGLTPPFITYLPLATDSERFPNTLCTKQAQGSVYEGCLREAADFLRNVQFNQTLNLCREAQNVAPNTYWLVSDNLLAYHALESCYPDVTQAIRNKMEEYDYFKSYSHEAMFGETLPYIPFRTAMPYLIERGPDYEVWTEIRNGSEVMADYMEYADLCLYAALHYHWSGEEEKAIEHFDQAKSMWDGKGLNDKAYRTDNLYGTRNLALLLYVARILNQTLENKAAIEEVLWSMQDENGGMHTGYDADFNYKVSDVNTETTSLTIIAYKYTPKQPPPSIPPIVHIILVVIVGVVAAVAIYLIKRRRAPASGHHPVG